MEILYLLIPIALLLVAAMIGAFLWAARSGQFDDLEGPAHRILMDDDPPLENLLAPEDLKAGTPTRHER